MRKQKETDYEKASRLQLENSRLSLALAKILRIAVETLPRKDLKRLMK